MTTYADLLERKRQLDGDHGFEPVVMPNQLFGFQAELVEWAVRKGRAALFADCGLGKTLMQLAWAQNVHQHTGRQVLIAAPLAVTFQVEAEAEKFSMDVATSRDGSLPAAVTVTNYDRLHLFDPTEVVGAVCDESSAIKSFDGKRRALVTDFMRKLPYRLLCTATAAPNDYMELGTSSEALGYLGYMDMLSRFFVNDGRVPHGHGQRGPKWRFKGHAEDPFWRWVSSWARALRRPSDFGWSDDGFDLPPLEVRQHVVGDASTPEGALFDMPVVGLHEERAELRRTLDQRCERAAAEIGDAEAAIAWCHLNDESNRLARLIDGAVEIRGSDHPDAKEEALHAFSAGEIRVLVTKPSIGGWGLNWQHCRRMTFFPSHSYEQYYQAVRRCWRFGQTRPVVVDLVTTPGGANALANLERKATQADRMFTALVAHMRNAVDVARSETFQTPVETPAWLAA